MENPLTLEKLTESRKETNKVLFEDRSFHDWYRFVLSYPPHLVRIYLEKFGLGNEDLVLDPFCGTGTTIVECKKRGIRSIGIESHPMTHFASQVKIDWKPDPDELMQHATEVAHNSWKKLKREGIEDSSAIQEEVSSDHKSLKEIPEEQKDLLLKDSISPLPLHKTLVLLESLSEQRDNEFHNHEILALAKALVYRISNLSFGPEVGIGPIKKDAAVIGAWLSEIKAMAADLRSVKGYKKSTLAKVYRGDSRVLLNEWKHQKVDAVITSPPYPNEKDYTRTTRLESVLLGFVKDKAELQAIKKGLVRSNTRSVYKIDDDDRWVTDFGEIQKIAEAIEKRRIELGKTSGFERLYGRVTKLYFGGMARHLASLRNILSPGAQLAYVVGDQASYLRIMIRTGQLIGQIAESLGYELTRIDLFRTRLATATKEQLREEVVVLRWPGTKSN